MPDFPLIGGGGKVADLWGITTVGSSRKTSATSVLAIANAKGAYEQIIAATPFDISHLYLEVDPDSTGSTGLSGLLDIAIGGAGSEKIIVPDLIIPRNTTRSRASHVILPLTIPAGVRMAMRGQENSSARRVEMKMLGFGQGFMPSQTFQRMTAYGVDLTASRGQLVDAGATFDTKGAYTQIVASTTRPMRAFMLGIGGQTAVRTAVADFLVDVAVGAAGQEKIIAPDLIAQHDFNYPHWSGAWQGPYYCDVPSGSRLAVRAACNTATAVERTLYALIYGFE